MRATQVLRAATYVSLGGMVVFVATLCLLMLWDLGDLEAGFPNIAGSNAGKPELVHRAARAVTIEPLKTAIKQPPGPSTSFCSTCQPPLGLRVTGSENLAQPGSLDQGELAQGLRHVDLVSPGSTVFARTVVPPPIFASSSVGGALRVWGDAPRLFHEALHKVPQGGELRKAESPEGMSRVREYAGFIGMGAVVSGLLLAVLIHTSFVAARDDMREVTRAKSILELSAQEATADLQRTIETLRLHSTHVDAAIEEERVRIAHDIHDDLGSILTALKLELSGASSRGAEAARKHMVRRASTDLVDSAMQSVRRLITALHPYPLELAGLWGALSWRAGELEKSLGIPCRVFMSEDLPQPSKEISLAAYRIVEEALTNVARHAHAKAVQIVVHFEAGHLVIDVTDDGCGISNGAARAGAASYGVTGMRARARAVGGTLTLAARAHHGTTVRFAVHDTTALPSGLQAKAA